MLMKLKTATNKTVSVCSVQMRDKSHYETKKLVNERRTRDLIAQKINFRIKNSIIKQNLLG